MALGNVVLLTGIPGSHLFTLPEPFFGLSFKRHLLFPPFAGFFLDRLILADDGEAPGGGNPEALFAHSVITEFYNPVIRALERDWNVLALPHDWRKSFPSIAPALWDKIVAKFPSGDLHFVAHSQGGLVARFIWRYAGVVGQQSRIKRVVGLGVPHWGSYNAVHTFSRLSETYRLFKIATYPGSLTVGPLSRAVDRSPFDLLDQAIGSWPGLYELMPNLNQPNTLTDTLRPQLYVQAYWASVNARVRQARLTAALNTGLLLSGLSTLPPPAVMVNVIGRGISTASALTAPFGVEQLGDYSRSDGDGSVTRESARLVGGAFEVFAEHTDLPRTPFVLDRLTDFLLNGLPDVLPPVVQPGRFTVPGPEGAPGEESTRPPEFFSTIDLEGGSPRPAASAEPRPAYCP